MAGEVIDNASAGLESHANALEVHLRILEDPVQKPEARIHAVHVLRSYKAFLCAAESGKLGRGAADRLAGFFARLCAVQQVLPLKAFQLEKFWLNTVAVLERLAAFKSALKFSQELVQRMRCAADACGAEAERQDDAMELLSHACIRAASVWGQASAVLQKSGSNLTADPKELLELVELLECRVLRWILQHGPRGKPETVPPSTVWKSLLRCATTLPVACAEEQHLRGWRAVLRILPMAGDSPATSAKAVMVVMEEIRRSQALPENLQASLFHELWQCRPRFVHPPEDSIWGRVVEEAVRTSMGLCRGSCAECSKSELLIQEALAALGVISTPWRVNLLLLLVQLRIADLPLGAKTPTGAATASGAVAHVHGAGADGGDPSAVPGSSSGAASSVEALPATRSFAGGREVPVVELGAASINRAQQVADAARDAAKEMAMLRPVSGVGAVRLEREVERLRHTMGAKGFQRLDQQLLVSIPSDMTPPVHACLVAWSSMCCELGELFFQSALLTSDGDAPVATSRCSSPDRKSSSEARIAAAIRQCASPVRNSARHAHKRQEDNKVGLKEGGCSASFLASSIDLLCRSAPWAPWRHVADQTMPKLKRVMSTFLERRTKRNVPKEVVGFLKYLVYYAVKRDDSHAAARCLLQAIVESALQHVPCTALAEQGVILQLTHSMQAVLRFNDMTSMCWAAKLAWQARCFLDLGAIEEMRSVMSALLFPYVAAKLTLLKKALQECSEAQKLSATDVLTASRGWLSRQLQALASPHGNIGSEEGMPNPPAAVERFLSMLKMNNEMFISEVEGAQEQSWRATLHHLELRALEQHRLGLASGKLIPRESAVMGLVILHQVSLHKEVLTGAAAAGAPALVDVRQGAGQAATCAGLVLELARSGHVACSSGEYRECNCHLTLKAVLDMLERVATLLGTSSDNAFALEVGRLRVKQMEVTSLLRRPVEAGLAAAGYAAEALKSWRAYMQFEALDGNMDADVVRLRLAARKAPPHACERLLAELSEAADLFELLGLTAQAAEVLMLALVAVHGLVGPAVRLQLQYRLAATLARASVRSLHAAAGGARRAALRAAAETWWEAAEAEHSRLDVAAPKEGLTAALDTYRVEAACALLQASSCRVKQPPLQSSLLRLSASTCRGFSLVEALQVSAEWSACSNTSCNGEQSGRFGGVTALRLATQAFDLVKQLAQRPTTGSPAVLATQATSHSRSVMLQLRNLFLLGLCYERIGVPHWSDYFYSAGLRFLAQHSCGAADWQLRFLCARARLALAGFPCRSWQGLRACGTSGETAATCGTSCKNPAEAISDLESFWKFHCRKGSQLVLAAAEKTHDQAKPEVLPRSLEELDLPVDIAEIWAFSALRWSQVAGFCKSIPRDDWQEWAKRRPDLDDREKTSAECVIDFDVTTQWADKFKPEMSLGRCMGHLAQILRRCGTASAWAVCALHIASTISSDATVPLHASICLEFLCIADLCAQELKKVMKDSVDRAEAVNMVETFHLCAEMLRQSFECEGEWRCVVRDALRSLDATRKAAATPCAAAARLFRASLVLGIAALQTGIQSGHSSTVRCAAQHIVALSFDVAGSITQMQAISGETAQISKPIAKNKRRSRSTPRPRADIGDAHDLALSLCAGALPFCSGVSVSLLYELRSQQRGQEQPGCSLSTEVPSANSATAAGGRPLRKFCDGAWLAELPEDVAVAWLQLDRSAQVLQIARRVDGPNSSSARHAAPLAVWRVPLRQGAFEQLEAELLDLQRDHHKTVTAFGESKETDPQKERAQRELFWNGRNRFDACIQSLAQKVQDELLQEWRFLLMLWPSKQEAGTVAASFEDWVMQCGRKETWLPHSEVHCWMLSLLYWAAAEMQPCEVSSVLAALLQGAGLHPREVERLAVSLRRHRLAAWKENRSPSISRTPLLLFLDSAMAQFPLEACPALWQREVVRAVAPNVAVDAFRRLRGTSPAQQESQSLLPRGRSVVHGHAAAASSRLVPQSGFYILESSRDDVHAEPGKLKLQELLEDWTVRRKYGVWQGSSGERLPQPSEVLRKLGTQDVLVCMGHGRTVRSLINKDQVAVQRGAPLEVDADAAVAVTLLPPRPNDAAKSNAVRAGCRMRCPLKAVAMLMGCSTAKVFRPDTLAAQENSVLHRQTSHGAPRSLLFNCEFESFGMPLDLLIGGGPAVVGTLWDVLGGDLDLLSCALLDRWLAGSAASPGSGARRKRDVTGEKRALGPTSLAGALAQAREACRLKYLTGAAVVCYGIPL
mmetsp:Transcript_5145/g.7390  ORF Transcript_5145/g.7390 Transcript_5145/m.7390 type:complete len:2254 (+) Transcript_5145:65-6826(+)